MSTIERIHDSQEVHDLLYQIDTTRLARELGARREQAKPKTSRLRVAAVLSLAELIASKQVDGLLRQFVSEPRDEVVGAMASFRKWAGYIGSTIEAGDQINIPDLLCAAAAGMLARRPTEVRGILRGKEAREAVNAALENEGEVAWSERVRTNVSLALLLLVRQQHHGDVQYAGRVIDDLATHQKEIEAEWLSGHDDSSREATTLLGLYHLAHAVIRLSEFLLTGSVMSSDGTHTLTDLKAELQRLLIRAEEYLSLSMDVELRLWLNSVVIVLWRVRTDSIWVTGKGISERLDQLLTELAKVGRERPVFSLLPSQQEAIRKNLLDPSRTAVVLQMPTSAGKTLLAEFTIVQTFEAYRDSSRIVYIVPTRALATQVRRTLSEDLRPLGIQVAAAGSAFEDDPFELQMLAGDDAVVVATPEKLDLLLRAHPDWFDTLRLVIVDEAHLLHESERGVRLELLLATLRRERPQARLLLLTPFIENAEQVAAWLGGERGSSIEVHWRPSLLLLGLARIAGGGRNRRLTVQWKDPFSERQPTPLVVPSTVPSREVTSTSGKVAYLARRFQPLGTVLALYTGSRVEAESAAESAAAGFVQLSEAEQTPALRLAIALARSEFGPNSVLASALERGVAFHHSALSSTLRFLVEDQVRDGTIRFIAATTTLAQGMNFPVATVLIHSVHKPYGGGDLSPAEFWNIAGRAGRVGLVDRGLVIFTEHHEDKWEYYSRALSESVESGLLAALRSVNRHLPLKELYRQHGELRPFLQYLAHAAASGSPAKALAELDELLQGSLANLQVKTDEDAQMMRFVARAYLGVISNKPAAYLKTADTTGLGSFSFDELYAKMGDDPVLLAGPREVLARGQDGFNHLIEVLKWLPELELGIGYGSGAMSVESVAKVVDGWVSGRRVFEMATEFPGRDEAEQVRKAATYLFSKVSQTISWGAHAYLRGWTMQKTGTAGEPSTADAMLPSYIQFGVNSPEAAVGSLLGVPRQLAEPVGAEYRDRFGALTLETTTRFREFLENSGSEMWRGAVGRSELAGEIDPEDVRYVWRKMSGLS
ncbi:MAG: DEAD/DEAH box helicase [Gemmatimonadota bacterium]